jgi:hypothetical protein
MLSQKNIIPLGNEDKGGSHLLGVPYLPSHLSPILETSLERSLSALLPVRDIVEEVKVLSFPRRGSLSRLIDASCISGFSAIRDINPQAARSGAESSRGLEHSRFMDLTQPRCHHTLCLAGT